MLKLGRRLHDMVFTTRNLRRQAYIQFYIACVGLPISFVFPTRIQIYILVFVSWWQLILATQTFITAAEANLKSEEIKKSNSHE